MPHQNSINPYWNHEIIKTYYARELSGNFGERVKIAIIDTGVDYNHQSIERRFDPQTRGYNFIQGEPINEPMDSQGHGTLVARILAGRDSGIAPEASLYALKLSNSAHFSVRTVPRALDWCIANNIDIINMSFGTPNYNAAIDEKCAECVNDHNITLVSAAGNSETGAHFPSSCTSVISVGAIEPYKLHCMFSSVWPTVDVSAPGRYFYPLNETASISGEDEKGTSFAVPQVVGIIALGISLLKQNALSISSKEIKDILKESCIGIDKKEEIIDLVRSWIQIYDPERKLFKKGWFKPDQALLHCMYGDGIVQADKFIKTLKRVKKLR